MNSKNKDQGILQQRNRVGDQDEEEGTSPHFIKA